MTGELRMPAAVVWGIFFAPGVVFIVASIVRLQVDGITVLGAVFLILWAWLIGVFTREFWVSDPAGGGGLESDPNPFVLPLAVRPVSPFFDQDDEARR